MGIWIFVGFVVLGVALVVVGKLRARGGLGLSSEGRRRLAQSQRDQGKNDSGPRPGEEFSSGWPGGPGM
jgi:hypothetical protein